MIAWWSRRPAPTAKALVRISGEAKFILSYRNKIGVQKLWGVGSQGYVMVKSAGSCRTGEIESMGTVELVFVVLADC